MVIFPHFLSRFNLKNKTTSNTKFTQVLNKIGLDNKVGICMREDVFSTISGIVNLHARKGTHWIRYIVKSYFDSYGCAPPRNLLTDIKNSLENVLILNIKFKKK